MANDPSPAVVSLENERSASASRLGPVQEGLQGTFPASDPLSATTTAVPTRALRPAAQQASKSDAPRVDEALVSISEHRNDPYVERHEQVAALRDEIESLHDRVTADIRNRIRRDPWQAVGIAAAVGFVFGITR